MFLNSTTNKYFSIVRVFTISLSLFLFSSFTYVEFASGETCIGCHTKPKYTKEDVTKLQACINCHGHEDHPFKENASLDRPGWGPVTKAWAGDGKTKEEGLKEHIALAGERKEIDYKAMAFIPEGEFFMGSDDRLRDEKPAHVVYIDGFYIDRFEVTKKDYKKFVDDSGYKLPDDWETGTYPKGMGDHPVTYVDWYDAGEYCKWAGKRLPREREWEKGARGTDGRIYPWGSKWDLTKSNSPLRGIEATLPVGSFEKGKNQFGIYDMSGNVWEWVDEGYSSHPGSDYVNPEFGKNYGLLKGGSWWDCMFYGCGISAPTFNRAFFDPTTKSDSYGFRCAAGAK